jgi:preprotein translocase subunit SecF
MKFVRIFDPKSNLNFIGYFKISWIIALVLMTSCIVGLLTLGMPWGIDFLGGVEMQVKFHKPVSANEIREILDDLGFDKNQVQQFGPSANNEMLVRIESMAVLNEADLTKIKSLLEENFPEQEPDKKQSRIFFDKKSGSQLVIWLAEPYGPNIDEPLQKKQLLEEQRQQLAQVIKRKSGVRLRESFASLDEKADIYGAVIQDDPQGGKVKYTVQFAGVTEKIQKGLEKNFDEVEIRRVDFVDSQVSRQLRTDGLLAVIYAILAIVIYIAVRFDIYFSPGAVFSLANDILGALLVFILFRVEFDTPSIAALLTIVGYSINNTVVVYDRIRETLPHNPKKPLSLEEIKPYVNKAINDTLSRTINTTITTLCASTAIWIFATGSIRGFALVLSVGIIIGAFSSVFVAPASFLLAKRYIRPAEKDDEPGQKADHLTREDKAKGIV